MTIRARPRRKRSSSEIAASQVARLRRQAWYEEVVEFSRQGKRIAAIARELHMSPITVRTFVYAGAFPERSAHKRRQSYLLTPYLPYLHQRVTEGGENASLLWKEICQLGFTQGDKVVNSWLREYLGKPGRPSTEEEQAKHQSFIEKVAAEPGLGFASQQTMQEAKEPVSGEEAIDP